MSKINAEYNDLISAAHMEYTMSTTLENIVKDDNDYLSKLRHTVCRFRFNAAMAPLLYDQDGSEIHDFFAGVAVCNFGYNHPAITAALHEQINMLMHTSNWYYNTRQIEAAKLPSSLAFSGRTLFVNSGTEAN
jgi:acetylornithine/N-succinyldiaminopimelate aminotransferase